ncbi:hypothetical protein FTW19_02220 [Terriglobus albidus]|uniref:Choice-of-anchor D domain-containing protein n=1 Tax=Terriglobus albidus TaxID=1592106 RepID=A0A5B9E3T6_9BACT|nr:MBG domain-containing protein [Terriglobus albidus]QEE26922.1 hypothetical protein FTW19_02220 [Terriglobus albidus]
MVAASSRRSSPRGISALGSGLSFPFPSKKLLGTLVALLPVCVAGLFPAQARAQTASFSNAIQSLGSGFNSPEGVAVDGNGNVFVADTANNAVKKIPYNGGSYGAPVTLATGFYGPTGVAADGSGNVFVADTGNSAVKEIPYSGGSYGTPVTLGSGFSSPRGVAVDGSGNVFVADFNNNAVEEIPYSGGSYGTPVTLGSGFNRPTGVAVDGSGNVFVADFHNDAVKEIPYSGGSYGTPVTLGSGFSNPFGVAVDGSGNVFVADTNNNAVKEIPYSGGSYGTPVTLGSGFSSPTGVAVDGSGNVFVADFFHSAVKKIMTGAVAMPTMAVGQSTSLTLNFTFTTGGTIGAPVVLTMGAPNLDFTDAGTGSCTTNGTAHTYSAGDTCTVDVIFTPKYAGLRRGAVELTTTAGAVIATAYVSGTGTGPQVAFRPGTQSTLGSGFSAPIGVAVDGSGNVFVADTVNNAVKKIPYSGGSYGTPVTLGSGFNRPFGVAVDGSGNLFVPDTYNNAVKKIPYSSGSYGTPITLGSGFTFPQGVAVDDSGNVFVADTGNNAVKEIPYSGGSYGTPVTLGSGFHDPNSVAVDGSGNVFVADTGNNAVKEIPYSGGSYGTPVTLGSGFSDPYSVAVDGSGNVFVADSLNSAVKEIPYSGGSYGTPVTLGSGFDYPEGVAVDGSGNVFVADTYNNAVKKLDFADAPSLSFTSTAVGSTSSNSPQTVTLLNIGNADLSFPIPGTGNNPSISAGFTWDSSVSGACPEISSGAGSAGTLAAGSNCTLSVSFTPTATGSISGSLTLTDNALNVSNATQAIALSGTGTSGSVASFTITGLTAGTAGTAQTITVTAKDSGGSTYTGYTGTVHFTSSDAQAALPANYTFTAGDNGVHTFSVTLKTAGSQSVTVNDVVTTSATGTASATISAGAAASYSLSAPGTVPFYTAFSFNAYALDAYGNTATSYNGTAIMSSSDPGFSNLGPFTFSNGATTVYSAFKTAGNNTLTLTDNTTSAITGTATIYMPPGSVTGLTVSAPASTTAGQAISVTVRARDLFDNTVIGYTGTVSFSSTDTRSVLPSSYTFTGGDAGSHTFSATLKTPGNQSVTATDTGNSVAGTSGQITVTAPLLVVTTATDDAGTAANCTLQTTRGTGTDASCSLRDALLQAASLGAGDITFDSTRFATAQTISLTHSTLTIPSYTTVTGATSGSGATLTNLVTVQGGGSSSNFSVFEVNGGTDAAAMRNLIVANGYIDSQGGGLLNNGTLTITDCTFANNYAGGYATGGGNGGGAIFTSGDLTIVGSTFSGNISAPGGAIGANSGTVTIINSTFSANSAIATKAGGAIFVNNATVTISGSTFSGNTSAGGGAIFNYGTLAVSNSILTDNTPNDCGNGGSGACPTNGFAGNVVGLGNLASLGNYGGPTQTMIPLPGSAGICAGVIASIPSGITLDQRGYGRQTNYGGPPCLDSGAVQTSFALAFTQSLSDVMQNVAMSPAPQVALTEHAVAFTPVVTIPLTLLQGSGTLSGGSASTNSGIASYPSLKIDTAGTGDKLQASLALNANIAPTIYANSSTFNVLSSVSQLLFGTPPATPIALGGDAGAAVTVREAASDNSTITTASDTITLTVTGPSSYSHTYTAAAVNGVATFNLSSAALNHAGTYTYTASLSSLQAIATQTVNKGTATVALGSLSATYDGNAHAATATTTPTGLTVNFTYNGSATVPTAAGSYAVVATVSDADYQGTANGTLAIGKATAPVTLGSLSATYDSNAHAATATTTPTGLTVNFTYNGSATVPTAAGSYAVVATVSDTNYQGTANGTLTIGKATAPVTLGSLSATYDGNAHAATAITTPTALTVNFTYNGSTTVPTAAGSYAVVATISDANYQGTANGTLTIGKATATVTLANLSANYDGSAHAATATTTPTGLTVTLTYNGSSSAPTAAGSYAVVATVNDANYQGSTTGTLIIGKVTPAITWAAPAAITYGTPLSATQLNATSGTSGTFAYTPAASTVLVAGANQQLTVAFTPSDPTNYQNATASTAITVNKQGSATALTASATSLSPAQAVTLTATVTAAANGIPSGTVTFLDGSASLQTVTLTGSTASYSTTLASGAHTITATYSGNTNYLGSSTSSGVGITVASLDFTITSTGATSQTVVPGGAVNFTYALTPSSGAYPGPVSFSVSGLPNGATYTLSPNTIAANAGPQQVTLAVQTPASAAGLSMQHRGWALALLLLPFAGMRRLRAGSKKLARTLYILLAVCFCIGMTGCGSGNGFLIQGARDYAVTITASSGTISHTSTVNLNVQ